MSDTEINGGDKTSADINLKVAGQEVNLKNVKSINTILTTFTFFLSLFLGFLLYTHMAEAKDNAKEIAQTLKESNQEVAKAAREAAQITAEAMRSMAQQQKRANELLREQTCLLGLPPDRRVGAGEFCKRLSREMDR
jgi:predicted histidine transporter YuiF (NhaC family)